VEDFSKLREIFMDRNRSDSKHPVRNELIYCCKHEKWIPIVVISLNDREIFLRACMCKYQNTNLVPHVCVSLLSKYAVCGNES